MANEELISKNECEKCRQVKEIFPVACNIMGLGDNMKNGLS